MKLTKNVHEICNCLRFISNKPMLKELMYTERHSETNCVVIFKSVVISVFRYNFVLGLCFVKIFEIFSVGNTCISIIDAIF